LINRVDVVEVTLPSGQTMLARVHTTDPVDAGPSDIGLAEQLSFAGVTETLQQIGSAVVSALVQVRPERASVEFGLDLAVKSGKLTGLLVDGTANATLKVTLDWQRTAATPVAG
jgi:hypothetical protein